MRLTPAAVLATVLVATLACVLVAAEKGQHYISSSPKPQHRCIHDEIFKKVTQSNLPTVVMHKSNFDDTQRAANTLADGWEPLRIGVYTEDLRGSGLYCGSSGQSVSDHLGGTVVCSQASILTNEKRDALTNYLLPNAVRLHEKYLQVHRLRMRIGIPPIDRNTICGSFAIPSSHFTSGVGGADFVAYVASTPTQDNVVAWAVPCFEEPGSKRPVVGVSNVGTQYVTRDPETIRIIAHELLHALGFINDFFKNRSLLRDETGIRGKPGQQTVFIGANTVREAQRQYGCNTLQWMELEDEGGTGTAGSHWKRRNAKDELMAGIVGAGYYTAITIAAMEDLGFYKGNYAGAEVMPWGLNAGCNLLANKCMTNNITQWPSMFCNDTTKYACNSARTAVGVCAVSVQSAAVPEWRHYFVDARLSANANLADYCPLVEDTIDGSCLSGQKVGGMVIGPNARCLDAQNLPIVAQATVTGVCAEIRCDESARTYQVRFDGSNNFINCAAGSTIDLATAGALIPSGTITCAPYNEVCQILTPPTDSALGQLQSGTRFLYALLAIVATYLVV